MKVKGNLVTAIALGAAVVRRGLAGVTPARGGEAGDAHSQPRSRQAVEGGAGRPQEGRLQRRAGRISNEADAAEEEEPVREYIIHELQGYAYVRTKNYPEAAKALEPR